jgi:hypothetical protein
MEIPLQLAPPPKWPVYLAWGLALVLMVTASWCQVRAWAADDAVAQVEEQAMAQPDHNFAGPIRAVRLEAATWRRRRLGLALAACVLGGGGFFAEGFRRLHHRMAWAYAEEDPPA